MVFAAVSSLLPHALPIFRLFSAILNCRLSRCAVSAAIFDNECSRSVAAIGPHNLNLRDKLLVPHLRFVPLSMECGVRVHERRVGG